MQSRRWIGSSRQVFAILAIALTFIGIQPASGASASTSHSTRPATQASTKAEYPWKGGGTACAIRLPIHGIITYKLFTTCPPKKVLFIGDSIGLTMGIQMSLNQSNWGTLIDNASLNGCGFITGYSLEVLGQITAMNPRCADAAEYWEKTAHLFRPQAIVIELGWEDSFQHLINGQLTSLNQLSYVQMLEQHIKSLVAGLRAVSSSPIYFLSVPWSNPGTLPNGQPEPAASATSHDDINTVIKAIASSSKNVHFVDISRYITPSGKYATDVDGAVCRGTDGVELYFSAPGAVRYVQTRCGKALQRGVLSIIRKALVPARAHAGF